MENIPFIVNHSLPFNKDIIELFEDCFHLAEKEKNEFLTPEHLLFCLLNRDNFQQAVIESGGDVKKIIRNIESYLNSLEKIPEFISLSPDPSQQFEDVIRFAETIAVNSENNFIKIIHLIKALFELQDSFASYYLLEEIRDPVEFISKFSSFESEGSDMSASNKTQKNLKSSNSDWKDMVVCLNDLTESRNPLIGREEELQKTIRVLCRKDKNNPLHIGEPGVGKTALVYGLTSLLNKGDVPESLKNAKIYQLDLSNLVAGTQFRGDFEKKLKTILEGVSTEKNSIIYIDEIHNLVGAGATSDNSLDASNMLKPYLEKGDIRFIGSTTYDEFKRYFAKSKGIVRRFSQIDIPEPSEKEAIEILKQLKDIYGGFHNVTYSDEAIEFAVKGTIRYMPEKFLPDKALDIIDEAGATRQIQLANKTTDKNIIDKELISEVLARHSKVDSISMTDDETFELKNLEENISNKIFGQDNAVREVSESILMSKAGLNDETKPLAAFLFVGPTGVGKTEVAKVLSKELGVELLRFDMSEYTEKHTVAKLIGSPAGYVGYEDGGLLTDAIRKTPNAVLLLDEIEKAHSDIYNILLQVMDYGKLTDNKGQKADFRNVVIIMTSNAGAQFAAQANVGFASSVTRGDAMLKQVKKTFKPEFLNRLSSLVVFNDLNKEMASKILDKKIRELENTLKNKNITLILSQEAREFLLEKGFTPEYGARELDRVIHQYLKRPLMKEILFGSLNKKGKAEVILTNDNLRIKSVK